MRTGQCRRARCRNGLYDGCNDAATGAVRRRRVRALLREPQIDQYVLHLVVARLQELAEILARQIVVVPIVAFDFLFPFGRLHQLVEYGFPLVDLSLVQAARPDDPAPAD